MADHVHIPGPESTSGRSVIGFTEDNCCVNCDATQRIVHGRFKANDSIGPWLLNDEERECAKLPEQTPVAQSSIITPAKYQLSPSKRLVYEIDDMIKYFEDIKHGRTKPESDILHGNPDPINRAQGAADALRSFRTVLIDVLEKDCEL